ncbi:MAG: hypothetical protein B7Z40_13570 [Bosea sp. 12-68-7]|nr:MAG: hypothetical protein B7Z40_13570 [Bosea sp. 12-68-7]
MVKGNSSTAVMQRRSLPARGLDFFPTPPWATRAFLHEVLQAEFAALGLNSVWEPAAGADGTGHAVGSFIGQGPDVIAPIPVEWIITNPPFNLAVDFAERALREAKVGVALLLRTSWMEGGERYERLFRNRPPRLVAQYCERVPMVAGRYDPTASVATSYAWFVWHQAHFRKETRLIWIAPGAKARHLCDADLKRWAS